MLQPSKTRYRKEQKGRIRGISTKGSLLSNGDFGIKAVECGLISAKHIETIRILISRILGKTGKMWIKVFPDKAATKKPAETRMGSGKGAPEYWVAVVKPGRVLFEVAGVSEEMAREAMRLAAHKLPMKTKFIAREKLGGE